MNMPGLQIPAAERRIFTVSNFITLSRILILPFIMLLMKAEPSAENRLALAFCVLWVFASDFLDGLIARKLNQVSLMGKILDPVSDKLATFFTILFATAYKGMPVWVAVIIIVRDLLILVMAVWVMRTKQFVTVSNIYGKWAVTFIGLLIVSYMFEITFLYLPMTILAMIGVGVSLLAYGHSFVHTLSHREAGG